jgi:cytoskeleton protein RodZ
MEKKIKKKNNIESNHQEKNQQDQSPINAEIQSVEVKSPGKADEKSDIKLDVKSESEVKSEVKSLGAIYRQKRQENKIEITQASNYLKVRPFDLNAIENDEINKISKNIYAPGLIRSYGKFLKIDEKTIEEKIRECAFRSNTENKKHILVNIGEHLALTPKKELLVNSMAISVILFLSMLLISGVYKKKLISLSTTDILEQIAKIEK